MEYNGYIGKVEYEEEAEVVHGEVINLRDVTTYEGKTVAELKTALADSVDDYLDYCRERNEEADRPFSGKYVKNRSHSS